MEIIGEIIDILFKIVITGFIIFSTREIMQLKEDICFDQQELMNNVAYIYNLSKRNDELEKEIEELKTKKGKKKI